jgi:hypothetical protein
MNETIDEVGGLLLQLYALGQVLHGAADEDVVLRAEHSIRRATRSVRQQNNRSETP